ncbi:S26 family signal peptidase [Longispora fulva]|uniref:Mitochondrial inner membrane protease subunit 2 n=1 Tax=Longispora fulva TaxID=619741 RepID=A0A8J7KUG1_9ACTN|nr:S26 family signal peptidase [Longispora fulva]MBG6133997.1 signal peptidase I [Longispora fulva]GIG63576.1 S26 family signal peptidase [Longispora fulva]
MAALLAVLLAVLVLAGLWAFLRTRLILVTVQGGSMLPSLRPGDRLLVLRRPGHVPRPGSVVLLTPPTTATEDGTRLRVKRLAAGPGDPVPATLAGVAGLRVPAGQVLVTGDHPRSEDSRRWGPIPARSLIGTCHRIGRTPPSPAGHRSASRR